MRRTILLSILLMFMGSTAFADIVVRTSDNSPPNSIIVSNLGRVGGADGHFDLSAHYNVVQTSFSDNALPVTLQVLIFKKGFRTALFEISSDDLTRDQEFLMSKPLPVNADWTQRLFREPQVVDFNGQVIDSFDVYFVGSSDVTHVTDGMINAAATMLKTQKNVTMIIYNPNYEMKVVEFELTDEQMVNDLRMVPVATDNIVLEPLRFKFKHVNFSADALTIYTDHSHVAQGYEVDDNGNYFYVASFSQMPREGSELEQYRAEVDLQKSIADEVSFSKVRNNPKRKAVCLMDLPNNLPRIVSFVTYHAIARPAIQKPMKKSEHEGEIDPVFKWGIILVIGCVGLILLLVISLYFRNERSKDRRLMEAIREDGFKRNALRYIGGEGWRSLNTARDLIANDSCNEVSREQLENLVSSLRIQLLALEDYDGKLAKLKFNKQAYENIRETTLQQMQAEMDQGKYGLASICMNRTAELDKAIASLAEALVKLQGIIDSRKRMLEESVKLLNSLNFNTDLMIRDLEANESIKDLSKKTMQLMVDVKEKLETERFIEPQQVADFNDQLHEAGNVGVTDNQIAEMQKFIVAEKGTRS